MDYKTIIASIFYWAQTKAEIMIKSPELFGKDEKPDKLVIKNQIGYHFKKVVREVNQELFVSRKIDVSLLFAGIQVLQKTETEVRKLCKNLPSQAPIIENHRSYHRAMLHFGEFSPNASISRFYSPISGDFSLTVSA